MLHEELKRLQLITRRYHKHYTQISNFNINDFIELRYHLKYENTLLYKSHPVLLRSYIRLSLSIFNLCHVTPTFPIHELLIQLGDR